MVWWSTKPSPTEKLGSAVLRGGLGTLQRILGSCIVQHLPRIFGGSHDNSYCIKSIQICNVGMLSWKWVQVPLRWVDSKLGTHFNYWGANFDGGGRNLIGKGHKVTVVNKGSNLLKRAIKKHIPLISSLPATAQGKGIQLENSWSTRWCPRIQRIFLSLDRPNILGSASAFTGTSGPEISLIWAEECNSVTGK